MPRHALRSASRRLPALALACGLALAAGATAPPTETAVGSFDAPSGKFRVRDSVLKKTFPDGTPIGQFQIRYFSSLPVDVEPGFFLVRSAAAGASHCRTEATRVAVHDDKAWLVIRFDLPKLVIDCGGLVPDCPSCQLRTESSWSCGCFAGPGDDTGRNCLSGVTTLSGDAVTETWLSR
jgi:hypothetical protein